MFTSWVRLTLWLIQNPGNIIPQTWLCHHHLLAVTLIFHHQTDIKQSGTSQWSTLTKIAEIFYLEQPTDEYGKLELNIGLYFWPSNFYVLIFFGKGYFFFNEKYRSKKWLRPKMNFKWKNFPLQINLRYTTSVACWGWSHWSSLKLCQ